MKRFLRSATLLLSCLGMTVGAALPSYGQGDTEGMGQNKAWGKYGVWHGFHEFGLSPDKCQHYISMSGKG